MKTNVQPIIPAAFDIVEKHNSRLVLSLRDNKISDNENVNKFRLGFLFSIFPSANSSSSV